MFSLCIQRVKVNLFGFFRNLDRCRNHAARAVDQADRITAADAPFDIVEHLTHAEFRRDDDLRLITDFVKGLIRERPKGNRADDAGFEALPGENFNGFSRDPGDGAESHENDVGILDADIYGHGKPTRIANSDRDLRQPAGSLPVTESMPRRCYGIPWFKHCRTEIIDEYANAFRKVAENAEQLKDIDPEA